MIRTLAITAALATASAVGLAAPASAQAYGGVTFSFGSGGYGGYAYNGNAYDEDAYDRGGYYAYGDQRVRRDYYDRDDRGYAWREHERQEQVERWREQQERRRHWQHERQEHQRWGDDDE